MIPVGTALFGEIAHFEPHASIISMSAALPQTFLLPSLA
jgi:hypothetical protein